MTKSNKTKLAIITALLCMMMLPVLACGITYCASTTADTTSVTVNYYASDHHTIIKSEQINKTGEITGIDNYTGDYQLCSDINKARYLTFTVQTSDTANGIFTYDSGIDALALFDKTVGQTSSDKYFMYEIFDPSAPASQPTYAYSLDINALFSSDYKDQCSVSVKGLDIKITTKVEEYDSKTWNTINAIFSERDDPSWAGPYQYIYGDYAGQELYVEEIFTQDSRYIYYNYGRQSSQDFNDFINQNKNFDAKDLAIDNTINIYTDYEVIDEDPLPPTVEEDNKPATPSHNLTFFEQVKMFFNNIGNWFKKLWTNIVNFFTWKK